MLGSSRPSVALKRDVWVTARDLTAKLEQQACISDPSGLADVRSRRPASPSLPPFVNRGRDESNASYRGFRSARPKESWGSAGNPKDAWGGRRKCRGAQGS